MKKSILLISTLLLSSTTFAASVDDVRTVSVNSDSQYGYIFDTKDIPKICEPSNIDNVSADTRATLSHDCYSAFLEYFREDFYILQSDASSLFRQVDADMYNDDGYAYKTAMMENFFKLSEYVKIEKNN